MRKISFVVHSRVRNWEWKRCLKAWFNLYIELPESRSENHNKFHCSSFWTFNFTWRLKKAFQNFRGDLNIKSNQILQMGTISIVELFDITIKTLCCPADAVNRFIFLFLNFSFSLRPWSDIAGVKVQRNVCWFQHKISKENVSREKLFVHKCSENVFSAFLEFFS